MKTYKAAFFFFVESTYTNLATAFPLANWELMAGDFLFQPMANKNNEFP